MRKRYFDDEKAAKPGKISDELREALDLHLNRLPIWIYKMRVLGYPPGWLHRANISNSSLEVFDDSHTPRSEKNNQVVYNPDCFVEFPGFNTPIPEGINDDCEYLGMPPMQHIQQLSVVKSKIPTPKPTPYKRLKLADSPDSPETPASPPPENQQGSSFNNLPLNQPKSFQDPSPGSSVESGEIMDEDDEIQIIEENLKPTVSSKDMKPKKESNTKDNNESEVPSTSKSEEVIIISEESGKPNTPIKLKSDECKSPQTDGKLKLIAMGSPVPSNMTHIKPPLEKFAAGMGELIYFENLPTSTGVFDKMRKVIHKIRKVISE